MHVKIKSSRPLTFWYVSDATGIKKQLELNDVFVYRKTLEDINISIASIIAENPLHPISDELGLRLPLTKNVIIVIDTKLFHININTSNLNSCSTCKHWSRASSADNVYDISQKLPLLPAVGCCLLHGGVEFDKTHNGTTLAPPISKPTFATYFTNFHGMMKFMHRLKLIYLVMKRRLLNSLGFDGYAIFDNDIKRYYNQIIPGFITPHDFSCAEWDNNIDFVSITELQLKNTD